jgi:RNA polymerase sigma factor (sigma-70 family)
MPSSEVAEDDRLGQLYRDEYEPMLALAYLLVGSRSAAEDVVHDAFTAISGRLDDIDNAGAYLRTSVVNGTRRWHRRLRREERWQPLDPAAAATPAPAPGDADGTADAIAVRGALADLPSEQREAIVLRYFADLTFREIADVLGCPLQTVATRVRRGLDRIKRDLEDRP